MSCHSLYLEHIIGMMADNKCSMKTAMNWDMETYDINLSSRDNTYIYRELKHYFNSYGMCDEHADSFITMFMDSKDYTLKPQTTE